MAEAAGPQLVQFDSPVISDGMIQIQYEYLMLVLSILPYLGKSPAHEELEKLMPWHPAVRHREYIRKE